MIRIVTDTASDITRDEASAMQVDIVALEITFDDGPCPHETRQDISGSSKRRALPATMC